MMIVSKMFSCYQIIKKSIVLAPGSKWSKVIAKRENFQAPATLHFTVSNCSEKLCKKCFATILTLSV